VIVIVLKESISRREICCKRRSELVLEQPTYDFSRVMPGGVPHWVLGTSNSLCVGRHFYAESTIRSSVISIAQTFILGTALTNDENIEARSFLFQLLVFWSSRLDKNDVNGGPFFN